MADQPGSDDGGAENGAAHPDQARIEMESEQATENQTIAGLPRTLATTGAKTSLRAVRIVGDRSHTA
jgi:hypothetical protein